MKFAILYLVLAVFTVANINAKTPCIKAHCFVNWTPEQCMKLKLAYVPASCRVPCAYCVDPKEVVEPISCIQNYCATVKCRNQTCQECKPHQVLVPRDGICYCCDTCVDKRCV